MDRDAWNERYRGWDLLWAEEPNRFVAQHCADLPPGRALDLACGEGRNAVWLADRGWRVTAVDWADIAIGKGRDLADRHGVSERVDWVAADLHEYEPAAAAFDLVLLSYLQVPPSDRDLIWPRAAAAVRPGGTFCCVAHDSRNLTDGYGGPQDPAVLYRAADVTAYLAEFEVVEAGEVLRPVETEDGEAIAVDCLVVARRAARSSSRFTTPGVAEREENGEGGDR